MIGICQRSTRHSLFLLLALVLASVPLAVGTPVLAQDAADDEIVYIDGDGFVRVLDYSQLPGNPEIRFVSPDRGYESVALGDFNGDGDMEIVAVGEGDEGDNDDDGKLVIWDPVPTTGGGAVELYRRPIDGKATMVAAGNFDTNINADEILFGFLLQDEAQAPGKDELFRITIIKGTSPNPDGREWTDHIPRKDDGNQWNYVTVGNVDGVGTDEVALLDEEGGEVNLYRIDDGFNRIWADSSSNDPYRGVAIGDFYQGGTLELAVSRNMGIPNNLFVLRYDAENDTMEGDYPGWNAYFRPYPRFLWPADIDGNNEEELFFLRRDQDPRLIGLNYPPKGVVLEANLNDDDFRVGVGGDFDADGRDEIVIASDTRLLVYTDIETGNRTPIEYGFTSDRRSLVAGDLDAEGAVGAPTFGLSQIGGPGDVLTTIDVTIAAGEQLEALGYYILNVGSEANVVLDVTATNNPDWFSFEVNTSIGGETDAGTILGAVYPSFDAGALVPGVYQASLLVRDVNTPSQISNSPWTVPVSLTVEPAALTPVPDSASFIYVPCPAEPPARSLDIRLGGLQGLNYSAAVLEVPAVEAALAALEGEPIGARIGKNGELFLLDEAGNEGRLQLPAEAWSGMGAALTYTDGVDEIQVTWPSDAPWVSATSEDGVIPDLLTLAIDPAQTLTNPEQAVLVIVADRRGGNPPANVDIVPIQYLCAAGQVHLPLIQR